MRKLCYLICLRHLIKSSAITNRFFSPKTPIFLYPCSTCSESPSNMGTYYASTEELPYTTEALILVASLIKSIQRKINAIKLRWRPLHWSFHNVTFLPQINEILLQSPNINFFMDLTGLCIFMVWFYCQYFYNTDFIEFSRNIEFCGSSRLLVCVSDISVLPHSNSNEDNFKPTWFGVKLPIIWWMTEGQGCGAGCSGRIRMYCKIGSNTQIRNPFK